MTAILICWAIISKWNTFAALNLLWTQIFFHGAFISLDRAAGGVWFSTAVFDFLAVFGFVRVIAAVLVTAGGWTLGLVMTFLRVFCLTFLIIYWITCPGNKKCLLSRHLVDSLQFHLYTLSEHLYKTMSSFVGLLITITMCPNEMLMSFNFQLIDSNKMRVF